MKKMTRVWTMAVVLSLTSAILTGCGCSNKVDNKNETSYVTETQIVTDEQGNTEYVETEKVTKASIDNKSENEKSESKINKTESSNTKKSESGKSSNSNKKLSSETNTSYGKVNSTVSDKSSSSASNRETNGSAQKPANSVVDPHAGKTYHEAVYKTIKHPTEYKDIKVIDKEAYTYEEPIYEEKWITVCNHCGLDITNNLNEHLDMEMKKGYSGSYHDEPTKEQIGTKTVTVPEEYHYETKKVKDEWTETVLVKKAGWY